MLVMLASFWRREIQRSRQIERRRVGEVERLDADLELPLAGILNCLRDAHVELPQRRAGDLAARAAERAEVGLPDRGDRRGVANAAGL